MSETALKSEDVKAATAAKTNGAAEHDDLSAHKESTFMYIVRCYPSQRVNSVNSSFQ